MVGFRGPQRLGTIICVRPTSLAQAMRASWFFLSSSIVKVWEADTGKARITQDSPEFGPCMLGEDAEPVAGIPYGRAQLNRLKSRPQQAA